MNSFREMSTFTHNSGITRNVQLNLISRNKSRDKFETWRLSLYICSLISSIINLTGDEAGKNKLFDIRCNNLNYKGDTHVEMCVRSVGE